MSEKFEIGQRVYVTGSAIIEGGKLYEGGTVLKCKGPYLVVRFPGDLPDHRGHSWSTRQAHDTLVNALAQGRRFLDGMIVTETTRHTRRMNQLVGLLAPEADD